MKAFVETDACCSGHHCAVCRDPSQGTWRLLVNAPDTCPHGLPWGWKGTPGLAQLAPTRRRGAERMRISALLRCCGCSEWDGGRQMCRYWRQCADGFRAYRNRPNGVCLAGLQQRWELTADGRWKRRG